MSTLKPGNQVDLIFESDYEQGHFRFLKAAVYDVTGKTIILSQTSPLLTDKQMGQAILVTYCVMNAGQMERYGFSAKITSFRDDYEMGSQQRVTALALERTTEAEQMNVRLNYRIRPTLDSGLALHYRGRRVAIIDISLGGAQFSQDTIHSLKAGEMIGLKLEINQRVFELQARVIRAWSSPPSDRHRGGQFVAVTFSLGSRDLEQLLSNKIMAIQRQLLVEGKKFR